MSGKVSGSGEWGLTSGYPAGVSGSGWRCSAPSASAAPAAAAARRPGSAAAHSGPAPAGTAPAAGQAAGLSWQQGALSCQALPCDLGPGLPLARPGVSITHEEAG